MAETSKMSNGINLHTAYLLFFFIIIVIFITGFTVFKNNYWFFNRK